MTKEQLFDKLMSRKFWLAVAAFLSAVGIGIGGLVTAKPWVAGAGAVCGVLASAIYIACEAYVDKAAVLSNELAEPVDEDETIVIKVGGTE